MMYVEWPSTDAYFNLALEQHIFDSLDRNESYFYLWRNDNAVVVGKNQNAVEEINLPFVERNGITVARRLSGGGAVYHDLGNLNFTFVTDGDRSNRIDFGMFCLPMAKALRKIGVEAEVNGRNDIAIAGKKFSGNSQYLRNGRVMHHGTILFDCDLGMVAGALNVSGDKIESKGLKSVRSRVTNIRDHIPGGMTMEEFKDVLRREILGDSFKRYRPDAGDLAATAALREEKYSRWEWNFGKSPAYSIVKKRRIEGCGTVEARMNVKDGRVVDLRFYGDFFEVDDCAGLASALIGCQARREGYEERLRAVDVGGFIKNLDAAALVGILA